MRRPEHKKPHFAGLFALSVALGASTAHAHQTSVTYLDVAVEGRVASVEVRIARADLGEAIGRTPLLVPTRQQALDGAARAAAYVAGRVRVTNGASACEATPGTGALRDRDADRDAGDFELAVAVRYTCARQIDDLALGYRLFFDLDPSHQAFASVRAFGATRAAVVRASEPTLTVRGRPSLAAQFVDYLELGVEHIFTGYDHVAFLFALLLVAGSLGRARLAARHALGVVTAFTAAHSLTLVCSALGWVRLPSRFVESAIAASIALVALDDLRLRPPRGRWVVAFAFGLLHGFGFASVLRELGLPRFGAVPSLLAFNLGVELGQVVVLALALPALLLLAQKPKPGARALAGVLGLASLASFVLPRFEAPVRTVAAVSFTGAIALFALARARGYDRGLRRGASLVLVALALLWLAERVLERTFFRGVLG